MHGTVNRAAKPIAPLPLSGALLAIVCLAVFAAHVALRPQLADGTADAAALNHVMLWDSLLPRAAIAVIAGATLGLSGALLQRILRNPIADASTLGIAAGAELAMTIAIGFFPALLGLSREMVAFAGGLAAVALVLAFSWRRGLEPVTVALSGMMVTLVAAALSVAVILARGEYAMSIYIWGAGALDQQSWDGVIALAPRLVIGFAAAAVLLRPLAVMGLDDRGAKSLGLSLHAMRLAILVIAVWLAASVTARVGVIGFVGFAAPSIARIAGARRTGQMLVAAPIAGAGLLLITDCLVQLLSAGFSDLAPTGAVTALLGGPLLLVLLPRLHASNVQATEARTAVYKAVRQPRLVLVVLAAVLVAFILLALSVGRMPGGWQLATGKLFSDLLPFRAPRTVVAAAAGAMLSAAGLIMQRLTGNPIASPEVLGVSAGGGAGLTVALFLFAFPSPPIMMAAMAIGGLAALLIVLAISARGGFGPQRMLLAGVAVGALSMAIVTVVLARGDMRGYVLLNWLSGSTDRAGPVEAWICSISLVVLLAPLVFFRRWLTILPLGAPAGRAVGAPVAGSRVCLAVLAALLTAIPSFLVGPLSLTGLIAPHLARLIGFRRVNDQIVASVLIGAIVLVAADWLARVVIYPYQLPTGLLAALIGGPYLIWLLNRRDA